MVLEVEILDDLLEIESIGFTFVFLHRRMCHAEHNIHDIRIGLDNLRHGPEHHFDALALANQAERQDGPLSLQTELVLVVVAVNEGQVRNSMGDESGFLRVDSVNLAQHSHPALVHSHDEIGTLTYVRHRPVILGRGLIENRVERGDDGRFESLEQQAQIGTGFPAKKTELVLHRNQIHMAEVDVVGRTDIVPANILANLELHRVLVLEGCV